MRIPISVVRCATINDSTPNNPTIASNSDNAANATSNVAPKRAFVRRVTDHLLHGQHMRHRQGGVQPRNHLLYRQRNIVAASPWLRTTNVAARWPLKIG